MNILFSGGGTLGPVTPLLAIADVIREKYPDARLLWVGTPDGPERALVEASGMQFFSFSTGKIRRYLSWQTVIDIPRFVGSLGRAYELLSRERPVACISAGGFVSVPIHLAAYFLRIPTWIHEQDVRTGLANRMMAPGAKKITTALAEEVKNFPPRKTSWLGNPVRSEISLGNREHALVRFHLHPDKPVVLIMGGGTGSARINALAIEALPHLLEFCQILHLTGQERPQEAVDRAKQLFPDGYHPEQFLTHGMGDAYAVADVVVSRAGFGSLSELAVAKRAILLIPKSGHQEENAETLRQAGAAAVIDERVATGAMLAGEIKALILDANQRRTMGEKLSALLPRATTAAILGIVQSLLPRDE